MGGSFSRSKSWQTGLDLLEDDAAGGRGDDDGGSGGGTMGIERHLVRNWYHENGRMAARGWEGGARGGGGNSATLEPLPMWMWGLKLPDPIF